MFNHINHTKTNGDAGTFEIQVQVEKMCGEVLFRLKTARCNKCKAWSPNTIGCEHFESRKGNSGQTGDYLWITWFTFKSRQMQIHFSKQIDSNVKSAFQKRKMLDHLCSQSRQIRPPWLTKAIYERTCSNLRRRRSRNREGNWLRDYDLSEFCNWDD